MISVGVEVNQFAQIRLIQETTDLVTITEEFLNGKLHFLCSAEPSRTSTILAKKLYRRYSTWF